jgi:predicted transposase YdaD
LFIDKCKTYVKDCVSVLEGINKAVDECIRDNILKKFLIAHRGEVLEVLLTEFDEEKYAKAMKKEAWEDGHESGLLEERQKNVKSMIEMFIEEGIDLECAITKISKKIDLSTEEVRRIWEKNTRNN